MKQQRFLLLLLSAAAFSVSLSLLAYSLVEAPFAYVFLGVRVYQWADGRVTFLEVASICLALALAATGRSTRTVRVIAWISALFTGAIFASFLLFNYGTNYPDGLLPQLFSAQTATDLLVVMDAMRLSPIYGLAVQTGAWFFGLVVSVFFLRLPKGTLPAILDSVEFGSFVLLVYGLGVYLIIPQWSDRAVVGLQEGTSLSWFTNDDLLLLGGAVFLLLLLIRSRASSGPAGRKTVAARPVNQSSASGGKVTERGEGAVRCSSSSSSSSSLLPLRGGFRGSSPYLARPTRDTPGRKSEEKSPATI